MKLQGIFADIPAPFDYKGDLYKAKVEHNVEKWNRTTLAGYLVCGPAGETSRLTDEERFALWELAAKYAGPEKVLIAGVGSAGIDETVALISQAAGAGYQYAWIDAVDPDETQAVAEDAKIPLILSGPAGGALHPNIAGILEARVRQKRPDVPVLAGSPSDLWQSLQAGAAGAVLAFASAAPYASITIWEAHRTREEDAGIDWQARIARAAELIAKYGVPALKYAMDLNGYYGGRTREPIVLRAEQKAEIEEAFRDLKG